ncbi:hypothetical protein P7K49_015101 [Saguinus oedipus]|uniref:Uncharacterized protein n=1 Tax=Saguinus oedipus TaxID=9490 RepID=A0ABQ9V895_SAGOE|nr:hypothetical protein P7K49_015101 [Saguinus oedipus]
MPLASVAGPWDTNPNTLRCALPRALGSSIQNEQAHVGVCALQDWRMEASFHHHPVPAPQPPQDPHLQSPPHGFPRTPTCSPCPMASPGPPPAAPTPWRPQDPHLQSLPHGLPRTPICSPCPTASPGPPPAAPAPRPLPGPPPAVPTPWHPQDPHLQPLPHGPSQDPHLQPLPHGPSQDPHLQSPPHGLPRTPTCSPCPTAPPRTPTCSPCPMTSLRTPHSLPQDPHLQPLPHGPSQDPHLQSPPHGLPRNTTCSPRPMAPPRTPHLQPPPHDLPRDPPQPPPGPPPCSAWSCCLVCHVPSRSPGGTGPPPSSTASYPKLTLTLGPPATPHTLAPSPGLSWGILGNQASFLSQANAAPKATPLPSAVRHKEPVLPTSQGTFKDRKHALP